MVYNSPAGFRITDCNWFANQRMGPLLNAIIGSSFTCEFAKCHLDILTVEGSWSEHTKTRSHMFAQARKWDTFPIPLIPISWPSSSAKEVWPEMIIFSTMKIVLPKKIFLIFYLVLPIY